MTVAKWRVRTTAAQRRQQREEFKALKARVAAAPSATTEAYKQRNRGNADRTRAKDKLNRALRGVGILPFTEKEAARLKPTEIRQLWEEMHNRLGALTAEERKALNERWYLAVVTLSTQQLRAIAAGPPP